MLTDKKNYRKSKLKRTKEIHTDSLRNPTNLIIMPTFKIKT